MRIIPAYAGKRSLSKNTTFEDEDHPRIRGEKLRWREHFCRRIGSSPHTRGKATFKTFKDDFGRIIPAYAGKRSATTFESLRMKDHPRIRGEKATGQRTGQTAIGSSPHTRGKGARRQMISMSLRIIPAYAGKSRRLCLLGGECQDHPRIRGEKHLNNGIKVPSQGSSPHTRGKAAVPRLFFDCRRIIPAYAGKSGCRG